MESIKTILDNLKEYKSWKDIWRETESKLKKRESKLATKYSEYAIDCVLNRGDVMPYEEWLSNKIEK
tara:strand:- start:312 stop:512 length:201 start_codon:yes stop_codon:yes gene_type:complete